MEESSSSERLCLVCSEKTSGCHFGIDACRACSAFFRRSVLENKVYHCRTGGSSIRCLCRKCRMKKCLDSGMQPSGVQGKRDSVGPNKKIREISVESSAFLTVSHPELPSVEKPQLLSNILKNHNELCAIRKATERALDPESYKSMETGGILAVSCTLYPNCNVRECPMIPTVLEFVTKSFEETQELDEQERWILLKPFLVYIWWIDACYRTYKRIPRDQFANLCIMSETTYFDVNRCEDWFAKDTIPSFLKQDLAKFIKKEMSADRQRSTFLMSDMQIKDVEYAALLGLLFWNSTVEECSERIHEIIRKGRARIYNDLGVYYRESKEFLAPVRIGELLNIQSAVMVETIRCREDLEIFNLFDAFEQDDYFYQMIRNIYSNTVVTLSVCHASIFSHFDLLIYFFMRTCVICQESTKGSHFGVDSCRACSEFFRRSIVDKRKYSCKDGGTCTIHKSIRRLCRKCRLEKCIDLGMQVSGVYITQKELERLDEDSQENSIEPTASSSQLHLETVWNNYQELCSVRTETEKRLDPEGYKTANQSGILKGMYHATPKIFNLFTRAHTPTVVEFVSKSIRGYEELSKGEREILLRPFLVYFWWMEGCYRVYKKAPKDLYTSLILVSDTSYMDVSRKDKLFDNNPSKIIPPYVVNDLMSLLKQELRADRQRSTFLMHEMQIRDFEMIALAELLFWNSTVEGCSDELHQKIHKGRGRVMMSLEKYYQSIEEPEPFVRMGSIINIQNATFIEIFRCREDMESYKIHDAFESFDFMYKVIKDV